ncbi:MAG: selenium-binding protein SBP56-related protein [Methyloglobulus sp.]|nr:selenium-binding protein [Methyloglobulus sp.]
MNTTKQNLSNRLKTICAVALATVALTGITTHSVLADETCLSPYAPKITGQEDFVYIWTLGVEGLGDEQDKLVTVDARPKSKTYGKVINALSVGGRNEAHHSGVTDDRQYLWAGGLDTNKLFVFDIHTDPSKPALTNTITDFTAKSGGVVGPHTTYALPGRMIMTGLSNNKDNGGRTGLVEYTNDGKYIDTHWMPTDSDLGGAVKTGKYADGYGYDLRVMPRHNVMFTSSFTGWSNYMMDFGKMVADPEAMKRFGNTVVQWDLHTKQPKKVFDVPGAPLEIRCAWDEKHDYCFTSTALTSKIWLIYKDKKNNADKSGSNTQTAGTSDWQVKEVANIGDPSKIPLPVDISISSDDKLLWVNTFMDGMTRAFNITDPFKPKQVYEHKIGAQVNMVSSSWDGKRVYFTTSLLANWDKKGKDNEQFIKGYQWNGKNLKEQFAIDFTQEKLGRPHQMVFGAYALYGEHKKDKN